MACNPPPPPPPQKNDGRIDRVLFFHESLATALGYVRECLAFGLLIGRKIPAQMGAYRANPNYLYSFINNSAKKK